MALRLERDVPAPERPAEAGPVTADEATASGTVMLRFSVRDTGIGITPDKLEVVFGAFTQVDASTTRCFGAAGWAWPSSNAWWGSLGGQVRVGERTQQNSTFVTVPLQATLAQAGPQLPGPGVEPAGARVLLVDDNATNRRILRRLPWPARCAVEEAAAEAAGLAPCAARVAGCPTTSCSSISACRTWMACRCWPRRVKATPDTQGDQTMARAVLLLTSDQRAGDADWARPGNDRATWQARQARWRS